MDTLTAVTTARGLIENVKHWCAHKRALDATAKPCDPRSDAAVCFCAEGALLRATDSEDLYADITYDAYNIVRWYSYKLHDLPLHIVNDSRGHEEILKVFDAAIAHLTPEETPNA